MELTLLRTKLLPTHTIGQLYINKEFFCFTLEDVVREQPGVPVEKWKIKHETAIPEGTYEIKLIDSPKYGPNSPWLQDVPGFTEILIHAGYNADHTSGCILVGSQLDKNNLINPWTTRATRDDLRLRMKAAADAGEKLNIVITYFERGVI